MKLWLFAVSHHADYSIHLSFLPYLQSLADTCAEDSSVAPAGADGGGSEQSGGHLAGWVGLVVLLLLLRWSWHTLRCRISMVLYLPPAAAACFLCMGRRRTQGPPPPPARTRPTWRGPGLTVQTRRSLALTQARGHAWWGFKGSVWLGEWRDGSSRMHGGWME